MKVLVINGDCIQVNSSANLCHLAYIKGLVEAGHEVHLLSAAGKDYIKDPSMTVPSKVQCHEFYGISLYEKMSLNKKNRNVSVSKQAKPQTKSHGRKIIKRIKRWVLSLYGPHGIYSSSVRKAKHFTSSEYFDCVLSLSTPPSSHLIAHKLISAGRVKTDRWIQVWEDPWYSDAYGFNKKRSIFKEEQRLLSLSDSVCYVSPITLEYQKQLFPESAAKMFWEPLPAYYADSDETREYEQVTFGYFGDYHLPARDLTPFYKAAAACGINVTICGDSNLSLQSSKTIHLYPRMPLASLKGFEEQAGVLVFLCNRKGGQIPGKIYQYAATSKTILFILDGTEQERRVLYQYFSAFNRFVFCENTEDDIKRAINRILSNDMGTVLNQPVTAFEPAVIVERILKRDR